MGLDISQTIRLLLKFMKKEMIKFLLWTTMVKTCQLIFEKFQKNYHKFMFIQVWSRVQRGDRAPAIQCGSYSFRNSHRMHSGIVGRGFLSKVNNVVEKVSVKFKTVNTFILFTHFLSNK